uniref:Uncharacterized protein n=1 Tax=Vespula pensylvanica TaxID=30213 RepID=A0A834KIY9_VESPE|nr:hypothetical protein H0235_013716 [Vespula pensylvanica]
MLRIISNNSNALRVPSKMLDNLANLRRFEFVWNEPCAVTYQMPLCGSVPNKLAHLGIYELNHRIEHDFSSTIRSPQR